jgi:hypothetical protein
LVDTASRCAELIKTFAHGSNEIGRCAPPM